MRPLRAFAWTALLFGCVDSLPQLVVHVDTDAPLVGQLDDQPELSWDGAIDTLRVDVLNERCAYDVQLFTVSDVRDWPLSFGVAARAGVEKVRVRLRAFRSSRAKLTHTVCDGVDHQALEPEAGIAIDRVVDLALPADGARHVAIDLAFECIGFLPSLVTPPESCVDGRARSLSDGVNDWSGAPTRAGSAPRARRVPCVSTLDDDHACIAGGFSVMGDPSLIGVSETSIDPIPLRAVFVSPFVMDKTEFTVGRFNKLLAGGASFAKLPSLRSAGAELCTWRGVDDGSADDLPLNCVSWATAEECCRLAGGALPTEAQWEHAARGAGRGLPYPWGTVDPECCTASLSRGDQCPGVGPEPAGSHRGDELCGGDVSLDGVLDLAGSLTEFTRDSLRPYDHACWSHDGIPTDPVCIDPEATAHVGRGSYFEAGLGTARAALRGTSPVGAVVGFRCVHPVSP